MARFSKSEIQVHREWLCQWRPPREMLAYAKHLMDSLGSADMFTQAGLEFIRNAWVAGKFGAARSAEAVRLVADEWPDFEIRLNATTVEKFEATESDLVDRRRGDEYRDAAAKTAQGASLVEDDPMEDWIARAEQVPSMLEAACHKKLSKRYVGHAGLVIYLNVNEFGIRQREIEICFPRATACAKDAFLTVWILWKDRTYLVWQDGRAAS